MSGAPTTEPGPNGEPKELAGGELRLDFPAEAVARLTLNNPDKRNPLSHPVLDAIAETLPQLDHGIDVRCVLITGEGQAFSAGYDIGAIPDESFERDAEALVAHPFTAAMDAISAHPYPVLAAINGHCLGGGLELAVRCDLRVCAAEAKLGMPPAKLGLIYGHTGLERFIDCVGVPRTKELFLTGQVSTAHGPPRSGSSTRSTPPPRSARGRSSWPRRSPPTRRFRPAATSTPSRRSRNSRGSAPSRSRSWSRCASPASRPRTSARAFARSARSAVRVEGTLRRGHARRRARGARPADREADRRVDAELIVKRRSDGARTGSRRSPGSSSASRFDRRGADGLGAGP